MSWLMWGALCALIFGVAFLYSSVGHGGATGYLAVLSLFAVPHEQMASTALILNILVAGTAFIMYSRAGYFSLKLTWPFIAASIPAAFLGGLIPLQEKSYGLILAAALLFAAWRLAFAKSSTENTSLKPLPLPGALLAGAGIGLLSGMLGIGGGIFLSPVILLFRWADLKTTSATAALFIVVNAMAGLLGRFLGHGIQWGPLLPFLGVAFLGGLLGASLGANYWPNPILKRLLSLVLFSAAIKLLFQAFA